MIRGNAQSHYLIYNDANGQMHHLKGCYLLWRYHWFKRGWAAV